MKLLLDFKYIGADGGIGNLGIIGSGVEISLAELRAEMGEPNALDGEVIEWAKDRAIKLALHSIDQMGCVVGNSFICDHAVYIPKEVLARCVIVSREPTAEELKLREEHETIDVF